MRSAKKNLHRILAPRLVVTIGTAAADGRTNIIPINNVTSVSTDPGMVLVAVHYPWITAENLRTAKGFVLSIPSKDQLALIWKLAPKYSGYELKLEKTEEFKKDLDFSFSSYGPVLKEALGWLECEIVNRPNVSDGNHLLVIAKYTNAMYHPRFFDGDLSPINNPKPIMQWNGNQFSEATNVMQIPYLGDKIR